MNRLRIIVASVMAISLAVFYLGADLGAADEKAQPNALDGLRLPKNAEVGASPLQVERAVLRTAVEAWKPKVNAETSRGPAADVFPKAAPAVVVVRTASGHGTGAIISPDGWIVTNHHVIADAGPDPAKGFQQAMVHLGRFDSNRMRLIEESIPAYVYKASEEKDLALLKLTRLPKGMAKLPFLELAKEGPKPASECVAIGHPASGVLWTVRGGEVSGIGDWPKDMTDIVTDFLALEGKERGRVKQLLAQAPQRKVVISSCGVNFGDSGGPLLDSQGRLIAVTFAMPKSEDRGTARFSYHIHLDEVQAFLADRPKEPQLHVPDPWPAGAFIALLDLDDDGISDTVVFGNQRDRTPTGLLMDLKQESERSLKVQDLADPQRRKLWHFQFALHLGPVRRAFYDTHNAGRIDLILTDTKGTGAVDSQLRLEKGSWRRETTSARALIDPTLLPDPTVRERFGKILKQLAKK